MAHNQAFKKKLPDNVSLHLKNIYKDRELDESATAEDFSVVQREGSREIILVLPGKEYAV
ncbi:MAG: hypothetical protein PF482_20645 [Desulfobacteraceae bacterium]|jgi:hypothetical protein|nr:hypothetical protein [Desulfobacteraceae bacterium]